MLGLLTYNAHPNLTEDDLLLAKALAQKNIPHRVVDWHQAIPTDVSHLLIRSPWDYYMKPREFLKYLDDCEEAGIKVINDAAVVRWNYTKHYLKDLAGKGLDVVSSVFVAPGTSPETVREQLAQKDWSKVVIKPTISGSSYLTFRTHVDSPDFDFQVKEVLAHGDLIAQPYLPSIRESGEISLIFFKGKEIEYSHAVHKLPKSGDFRVQNDFGGKSVFYEPGADLRKLGEKILSHLPANWLYTRVDLVDCGKKPLISEIEMIEPSLYFMQHPPAAKKLAEIISANHLY